MKISVIQPYYSVDSNDAQKCFDDAVKLLDGVNDADLIVMPEYSDVAVFTSSREQFNSLIKKNNEIILNKAKKAAVRCSAVVFVNCAYETENGYRNTTYAIDEKGEIFGKYFKAHPAPSEVKTEAEGGNGLDVEYSYSFCEPYVVEHNGIRYGFMTCYDFYFYEAFAPLARQNVDIIIGTSHQRTDTHLALDIIGRFLSYNTNAYLVRSAVTLGENSPVCGSSMVVAPTGEMILDMKNEAGVGTAQIDVSKKYLKPAGFKGALKPHYQYIEEGRRPWLYRNGGSKVIRNDVYLPYPRLCACGGLGDVLPKCSMPAYASAIALGASEICVPVYETKDGCLVSSSDNCLENISDGKGLLSDCTLSELKALNFGAKKLNGIKIASLEEILSKFAATAIINIYVKHQKESDFDALAKKIIGLLYKYDCEMHAYITSDSEAFLKAVRNNDLAVRLCLSDAKLKDDTVNCLSGLKCEKICFSNSDINPENIAKLHSLGIKCIAVLKSRKLSDAKNYFACGIDTVICENYLEISNETNVK